MKTLGIITEYNPFHNGHAFHLQKSLALTDADNVICVMSGNFIYGNLLLDHQTIKHS